MTLLSVRSKSWRGRVRLEGLALFFAACAGVSAQTQTGNTSELQRLSRMAQTAQQEGRYDDALRAYQTITVVAAGSPKTAAVAYLKVGAIDMVLSKYEDAAGAFQHSIALDAGSAESYNSLGESLGKLKRYPQALEAFQQAIALDGSLIRPRYNTGVTYERMGQLKYAEFVYRILIRDHPDFVLGYDGLAVTLSKSGRGREAIPFHEKAISLNPNDPSLYYNFGISCVILGDAHKAQELQQKLHDLDPQMADKLGSAIANRQP
jgi:tetratricopeptide (TPR) repeat protein